MSVLPIMLTYIRNRLRIKTALFAFWAEGAFSATVIALALGAMSRLSDYSVYYATGVSIYLGVSYGTIVANELVWERGWELYLLTVPAKRAYVLLARLGAWSLISLVYGLPTLLAVAALSSPQEALPAALGMAMALALASFLGVSFVTVTKLNPMTLMALHAFLMPIITRFSTAVYPRTAAPSYALPLVAINPLGYIADLVRFLQGFPPSTIGNGALALALSVGSLLGFGSMALRLYSRRIEGIAAK
jgi:ABC-type polysaccharide/polyol phosphate export permease